MQNAFIERFNRAYREEVLNANLFHSTAEAQALSDAWLVDYNDTGLMTRWAACRP